MDNSIYVLFCQGDFLKERVSEVLNRKRGFSLEMIRRLHVGLGIPADLLVGKQAQSAAATKKPQQSPKRTGAGGIRSGK